MGCDSAPTGKRASRVTAACLHGGGHAQRRRLELHEDALDAGVVRSSLEGLDQSEHGQLRLFEELRLRGEPQLSSASE